MNSTIVIEKVTASTKRWSRGTHQMYRVASEDFLKTQILRARTPVLGCSVASGSSYFRKALATTASIVPGTAGSTAKCVQRDQLVPVACQAHDERLQPSRSLSASAPPAVCRAASRTRSATGIGGLLIV